MMKFTQITDKLNYPPEIRGELSTLHASIITYVMSNFRNVGSYKSQVVETLNTISHYMVEHNSLPSDWSPDSPLENLEFIDQSECEKKLGALFLRARNISWDVEESAKQPMESPDFPEVPSIVVDKPAPKVNTSVAPNIEASVDVPKKKVTPTPKDHLYMRPPTIPQFDIKQPWLQQMVNNTPYVIYKSLPEIPVIQNQVSVTTDVDRMTTSDFMKLYPNCFIKTRPTIMYEACSGLTLDPDVGLVIPIVGFSPNQVRDNIIKYPNWFKLTRLIDGKFVNFYNHIELNGELHETLSVWDELPESKQIPRTSEFIKEYVVRRYLLERDLKGINHKYPMFGTFEPYMVLFTSADEYKRLGYKDVAEYGKLCVIARVNYKRSRNPILRQVSMYE